MTTVQCKTDISAITGTDEVKGKPLPTTKQLPITIYSAGEKYVKKCEN